MAGKPLFIVKAVKGTSKIKVAEARTEQEAIIKASEYVKAHKSELPEVWVLAWVSDRYKPRGYYQYDKKAKKFFYNLYSAMC